jgi:hypothetical protein
MVRLIAYCGRSQPMACRKTHFSPLTLDLDIRYPFFHPHHFPFLALSGHLSFPPLSHYDLHPVVHHHLPRYTSLSIKGAHITSLVGTASHLFPLLPFYILLLPPPPLGPLSKALIIPPPFRFVDQTEKPSLSHNANDTITCLCCCFCTTVNMQHCTKFQSRALVDGHAEENKSDKATSQQCTATHAVSDRDTFVAQCHMDAVLVDAL